MIFIRSQCLRLNCFIYQENSENTSKRSDIFLDFKF